MDNAKQYLPHFLELKKRLSHCVIAFILVFLPLFLFSRELYSFISQPLIKNLPTGGMLVSTQVMTTFTTPLKLTLFVTLAIIIPYILFQCWSFVAPALYPSEKKLFRTTLSISTLLFYSGMFFAHTIVLPMALHFFTHIAPQSVTIMTDMTSYLDFILAMYFAFGLAFQVPIITFLLCKQGIVAVDTLEKHRPFIIVSAFVLGMLLTPPDVVSQILLAVPLWFLFESGFWLAKRQAKKVMAKSVG